MLDQMLATGTFGRLTVRGLYGKNADNRVLVLCDCSCGNTGLPFIARHLLTGNTQSCGCFRRDTLKLRAGLAAQYPAEYIIFCGMKRRCYNSNEKAYARYGGRGITICPRWLERKQGFDNFMMDMGARPSPDLSIERKENNGPYAPWNCVWATDPEQARNKSTNRILRVENEAHCLQEWANIKGMDRSVLKSRLKRGWSVDDSLTRPIGSPRSTTHYLTLGDESLSITDWERRLGWKPGTIKSRMKHGWTVEQALSIPLGEDRPDAAARRLATAKKAGQARMQNLNDKQRSALGKRAVHAREAKRQLALTATP